MEDCEVTEFLRFSELELVAEEEEEHFLDFFSPSEERLLCLLPCDLSLFFEVELELEEVVVVEELVEMAEPLLPLLISTSSIELFGGCFCTCVIVAEELLPLEDELLLLLVPPVVPTLVLPGTETDFCNKERGSVLAAGTLRLLLSCCCCCCCWLPVELVVGFGLGSSGGGGGAGCTAGGGAAVFGNGG